MQTSRKGRGPLIWLLMTNMLFEAKHLAIFQTTTVIAILVISRRKKCVGLGVKLARGGTFRHSAVRVGM